MVPKLLDANRFELLRTRDTVSREPSAQPPIKEERLRIGKTKKTAAGIVGVQKSFSIGLQNRKTKKLIIINNFLVISLI